MKKTLICLLSVLLTLCLFVGCSSSPKEEKIIKLKIFGSDGVSTTYIDTIDFNVGNSTHFGDELVGKTIIFDGKVYTYKDASTTGLDGVFSDYLFWDSGLCTILVYEDQIGDDALCCGNTTLIEEKTYNCVFFDWNSVIE